jgi:hypothetical protein
VREQLAGDEMVPPPYANLSTAQADRLVATGFLRMGPDGTGDGSLDQNVARNEVMAETIKIVSTSLLGMTVGCAQCHSHRYEPISQTDYYRLRAIFEPAYDWKNWRAPGARLVSLLSEQEKKHNAEVADEAFDEDVQKVPEEVREPLRAAYKTEPAKRNDEQKKLAREYPNLFYTVSNIYLRNRKLANDLEKRYADQTEAAKKRRIEDRYAQALTEVPGKTPATFVFFRGDFNQPRQQVKPAELGVLASAGAPSIADDDPKLPTSGRRKAYAEYLTSGKHPLLARVLVNRVWLNHFDRGIVPTPGDFGMAGQAPSHPELLDWLAQNWMSQGWRLKPLHKLLMTSSAYLQQSKRTPELERADPDNRLLGRMSVRRLEAEMIRDAVLTATGTLNRKMFGPPVPVSPDEVGQIIIAVDTRDGAGRPSSKKVDLGDEVNRRSVYIQVRRSMPLCMLDTFDAPRLSPNCEQRNCSTVAPQSLLLLNNTQLVEQSAIFAQHLQHTEPGNLAEQVKLAWESAYADLPTAEQLDGALKFLESQTKTFTDRDAADKKIPNKPRPKSTPAERALATLCQALLCSNQFLYVD